MRNTGKRKLLNEARKQIRKELKFTKNKHTALKNVIGKTKAEIERLQHLITEAESVTLKNEGVSVKMELPVDPNWVNGVWIVAENDGTVIELYKFYEYIREIHDYKKLKFFKPKQVVGSDGKEVTFNKGDLLLVAHLKDLKGEGNGIGLHFANVGPSDERGQLQLELALHRLGMGPQPCSDKSFLVVDGNFRKVN